MAAVVWGDGPICLFRSGYKTKNTGVVAKGPLTGARDRRPAFTEQGLGLGAQPGGEGCWWTQGRLLLQAAGFV